MFERFTDGARHVVVLAQEEARLLDHNYIGTEHILLGLLREDRGAAGRVLAASGVTLEAVRAQVEEMVGRGPTAASGHVPFTPRAKKILELSLRESLTLRKSYIGTEHILLALIREGEGVGVQILERLGPGLAELRGRMLGAAAVANEGAEAPDPKAEAGVTATVSSPPGWPAGWPPEMRWRPTLRVPLEAIRDFRELLYSVDQRLANIERHLGIDEDPAEEAAEDEDPAEGEDTPPATGK